MKFLKKIKKKIKNFLEKLGEENEKRFGSTKLDCCDLNKNKKK